MTTPTSLRISPVYVCTGGETLLGYPFRVLAAPDLVVLRLRNGVETPLALGTDYTVSNVGAPAGGNVVLAAPATAGDHYVALGAATFGRLTDIAAGRSLAATVLNAEWDADERQLQELARDLSRTVKLSLFDTLTGDLVLDANATGYLVREADGSLTAVPGGPGGSGPAIPVPVAQGGTGQTSAPAALAALGGVPLSGAAAALGLGALAFESTVAPGQIAAKAVALGNVADNTPGTYLGFDSSGHAAAVGGVTTTRITQLGRVNGFGGGLTRHFVSSVGEVFAVGDGTNRQNGVAGSTSLPVKVLFNVAPGAIQKVISGAKTTYVLDANGWVFAFGGNAKGEAGLGDQVARAVATRIEWFVSNSVTVADVIPTADAGGALDYTLFLGTDGYCYGAGDNSAGQLGLGSTQADTTQNVVQTTPVKLTVLGANVAGVAPGGNSSPHTLAWKTDGTLWGCGTDTYGQLGRGTTGQPANRFAQITGVSSVAEAKAAASGSGSGFGYSLIRLTSGAVAATGYNASGQLGLGVTGTPDTTSRSAFTTIAGLSASTVLVSADGNIGFAGVITTDARLALWGHNGAGQIGNGTTTNQTTGPYFPAAAFQGSVVSASLAGTNVQAGTVVRTTSNQIWGAGYASNGNLGTGSTAASNTSFAAAVGITGTLVQSVVVGTASTWGVSVLRDDGHVLVAGAGVAGQLGLGIGFNMPWFYEVSELNRGAPATALSIGTVTALAPGATPTVGLRGSPPAQIVDFGIPGTGSFGTAANLYLHAALGGL